MPGHKKAYHAFDELVYEKTSTKYADQSACADPGSFVRVGSTSTTFFFVSSFFELMKGERIQTSL